MLAMKLSPGQSLVPGQSTMTPPASKIDLGVVSFVAELPEGQQDKWIKAYIKVTRALKEEGI